MKRRACLKLIITKWQLYKGALSDMEKLWMEEQIQGAPTCIKFDLDKGSWKRLFMQGKNCLFFPTRGQEGFGWSVLWRTREVMAKAIIQRLIGVLMRREPWMGVNEEAVLLCKRMTCHSPRGSVVEGLRLAGRGESTVQTLCKKRDRYHRNILATCDRQQSHLCANRGTTKT